MTHIFLGTTLTWYETKECFISAVFPTAELIQNCHRYDIYTIPLPVQVCTVAKAMKAMYKYC
jgi:hypothetical protein